MVFQSKLYYVKYIYVNVSENRNEKNKVIDNMSITMLNWKQEREKKKHIYKRQKSMKI